MSKLTATGYLFSLLFYGMGSSKMSVLNEGHWNTHDVFLATVYFVLTIFFIVVGSVFFINEQFFAGQSGKFRAEVNRKLVDKSRPNTYHLQELEELKMINTITPG